eukprot:5420951-Prymnesium_polylepis.2
MWSRDADISDSRPPSVPLSMTSDELSRPSRCAEFIELQKFCWKRVTPYYVVQHSEELICGGPP